MDATLSLNRNFIAMDENELRETNGGGFLAIAAIVIVVVVVVVAVVAFAAGVIDGARGR